MCVYVFASEWPQRGHHGGRDLVQGQRETHQVLLMLKKPFGELHQCMQSYWEHAELTGALESGQATEELNR